MHITSCVLGKIYGLHVEHDARNQGSKQRL